MPALSSRIRRLAAVAAVIIGGAGGAVAGPAWLAAATTAPHVTLSPGSGPPTSAVRVSGAGFGAHKAVDIYLDTTDEALATTNASGSFSNITITVPASSVPGKHWVTAIQRPSGPSAQAAFTVRTNWSQFRYSGNHTGSNPYENVLSPANVAALDQAWSYPTGADLAYSSPAVVNGVLYAGSDSGNVYALNASTGARLWSYATGSQVDSSPAVANGVAYVGSNDHNVYALKAATGAKLWSYTTGDVVLSSPVVANGVVYIGSNDGNVYALNAVTGARLWSYPAGGGVDSSPTVVNGVVYVSSLDGNLHAFRLPGGLATPARPSPGNLHPNDSLRTQRP